ncbi:MAG: GYF domain-containing protein [Gemmataceae bacterium]|nr:GYF domain-containing protein [Gemmataceae bacterium]
MGEQWYYTSNGEQLGPVAMTELQRLAAAGQLQPDDLVWRDGMHAWIPARTARGLFPHLQADLVPAETDPLPVALPVEAVPAHASSQAPSPHGPRQRPRQAPPPGMSTGAKVALIGGLVVGVVIVLVVIVLATRRGGPRHNESGTYTVHLNPGNTDSRFARFVQGQPVTITVTSDHFSNVDLAVIDSRGIMVASDLRPGGHCFVNFVPARTDSYRIEVVNHGPIPNRCVVRYN